MFSKLKVRILKNYIFSCHVLTRYINLTEGLCLMCAVMDKVVSKVESELLCRAYVYMYLGDDPFDKDAKEKFGMSLLSLL